MSLINLYVELEQHELTDNFYFEKGIYLTPLSRRL